MKSAVLTTMIWIAIVSMVGLAQQRFDMIVREDFFAGFSGNTERFDRAMKVTEDALAKDPKNAEAKVWHGSGVFFQSNRAFQKGDFQNGLQLWQRGLDEMEQAVKLAPENISVLIPRGAVLIASSRFTPPDYGKPILQTGLADFEKVLKIQEPTLAQLSTHSKGELLTGLADGWSRLGNSDKARQYFERIAADLKGSIYEQKARAWLDNKPEAKSQGFFNCSGCHVK